MPTIVAFPTLVKDAVDVCGDRCANAPARRHVADDLTGLMVAAKKTGSGIRGACVVPTDPSGLHRWLHEGTWDVKALNDRRWEWLQRDATTRYSPRGVLALEQTLVEHAGKRREDVGWCWDPATARYVIAHESLLSNAVCPSGAPSPIAWRRCKHKDACPQEECTAPTEWCSELRNDATARGISGDCPCDSSCTSAKVRTHMQRTKRADGGALQRHRTRGV